MPSWPSGLPRPRRRGKTSGRSIGCFTRGAAGGIGCARTRADSARVGRFGQVGQGSRVVGSAGSRGDLGGPAVAGLFGRAAGPLRRDRGSRVSLRKEEKIARSERWLFAQRENRGADLRPPDRRRMFADARVKEVLTGGPPGRHARREMRKASFPSTSRPQTVGLTQAQGSACGEVFSLIAGLNRWPIRRFLSCAGKTPRLGKP